jgi:hypothetical protein
MVDGKVDLIEMRASPGKMSDEYRKATRAFEKKLPEIDVTERGTIKAGKLWDAVIEWENSVMDKIDTKEFEILEIMDLVVGALDIGVKKIGLETHESSNEFRRNSIEVQREAVKIVFSNLGEDGMPNESVVRTMSLVTKVFEEKLGKGPDVFYERGLENYVYFWQGIMGMITAVQMFRMVGWEVALGPIQLDLNDDVDLVAIDPEGKKYTVDVSSKIGLGKSIVKGPENNAAVKAYWPDIAGRIVMNVPPLRSSESNEFYSDRHRRAGTPSKQAIEDFRKILE